MADTVVNFNEFFNNVANKYNTLLDCPIQFSGEYGPQKIIHFLKYIESYKEIKCITDKQACAELEFLLTGHAYTWWQRCKNALKTWCQISTAFINEYSRQRPAYLIYRDIFVHAYKTNDSLIDFIDDKYQLLNELPEPKPSERRKIDIISALLPIAAQSKLVHSNISSLLDLKEHLYEFEWNRRKATNGIMYNADNDGEESKENVTRIEEILTESNGQAASADRPSSNVELPNEIHIINDNECVIKVKRTEDLMPHDKRKERQEINPERQEEFLSIENNTSKTASNENNNNFHIDTDIMNQINNIIDESEMYCDFENQQIYPEVLTSNTTSTTRPSTLNSKAMTIQAKKNTDQHSFIETNNGPKKKRKMRCSFCRLVGHKFENCFRKGKKNKLNVSKGHPQGKVNKPKNSKPLTTFANNNNIHNNNNILRHISSFESNPHVVNNISTLTTAISTPPPYSTLTSGNSVPALYSTVASVGSSVDFSQPLSLPPVPATLNHTTTAPLTSSSTSLRDNSALSTKLIAPINSSSSSKQLAAKLRNINVPSPKCHQCGTVGFYKSICPNCSPIYNSKQ